MGKVTQWVTNTAKSRGGFQSPDIASGSNDAEGIHVAQNPRDESPVEGWLRKG